MQNGIGTVARAFQLAKSADSIDEIRTQLKDEGYLQVDAHFQGPQIKKDLRRMVAAG